MKEVLVRLLWSRSVSSDVVQQFLNVSVNNEALDEVSLDPLVESYEFWVDEKAVVAVAVTVSDGVNLSDPATLSFTVPDVSVPLPVTGLTYEVVDVRDKEEV